MRTIAAGLLACACVLASCANPPDAGPTSRESSPLASPSTLTRPSDVITENYLPGRAAQIRTPAGAGPAPLIVMVPGGGWSTADPTGLIPLAEGLTADGSTTSLITYSTTSTASRFPTAVDDVACAIRWSAAQAAATGHAPSRTIVLGHSAGGHLAALVAFSGNEFGSECPYPPIAVDGLIGIAGIYDTDRFQPVLSSWMAVDPSDDPKAWERVNPMEWLASNADALTGLHVLLIHGDADTSVPLEQTVDLGRALQAAHVPVSTTVLPGLGHLDVFQADNVELPITEWLSSWT